MMKSSQSNFDLRSPSSYLARSYLIAAVPKNQHTQRKLLNVENWVMGRFQKETKFAFESQFSTLKIIRIFLNLFNI